ncbi:hypothetical protein C8J56DRAFT_972544 [Mycena floridula]|nr:hypothetical protein C8J56DRAFT_972544 [Mycena floridula]
MRQLTRFQDLQFFFDLSELLLDIIALLLEIIAFLVEIIALLEQALIRRNELILPLCNLVIQPLDISLELTHRFSMACIFHLQTTTSVLQGELVFLERFIVIVDFLELLFVTFFTCMILTGELELELQKQLLHGRFSSNRARKVSVELVRRAADITSTIGHRMNFR